MMLTKYNEWCIIYTSFVVFCVLMKINKNVYRKILANTPVSPIEIGGIIGMKSEIVTDCFLDYSGSNYGKYCPDIELINKKINTKQGAFPNENALLKLLYLRITELYKKCNGRKVQNWAMVRNQLATNDKIKARIEKYEHLI